jgi:hypothetical protein
MHRSLEGAEKDWRPVRSQTPCRRRERDANHCNSMVLRSMDGTLLHLNDSQRAAFVVIGIDEIRTLSRLVDDAEDS